MSLERMSPDLLSAPLRQTCADISVRLPSHQQRAFPRRRAAISTPADRYDAPCASFSARVRGNNGNSTQQGSGMLAVDMRSTGANMRSVGAQTTQRMLMQDSRSGWGRLQPDRPWKLRQLHGAQRIANSHRTLAAGMLASCANVSSCAGGWTVLGAYSHDVADAVADAVECATVRVAIGAIGDGVPVAQRPRAVEPVELAASDAVHLGGSVCRRHGTCDRVGSSRGWMRRTRALKPNTKRGRCERSTGHVAVVFCRCMS